MYVLLVLIRTTQAKHSNCSVNCKLGKGAFLTNGHGYMGNMVIPLNKDQEKGNLYRIESVCGSKTTKSNSVAIATVTITTELDAVF